MKNALLTLLFILSGIASYAQDSVKVSYSQEADTLVKQRFIDRYENVFMTKVPTRHMFKVGLSQYYQANAFPLTDDKILNNTSLQLGYEFKFLPAFSIAVSGHVPYFDLHTPFKWSIQSTVIDAQLRWFVDMRRRIKSGKSANNFSGNYVALFYNIPGTVQNDSKIGFKVGFQRRFLNRGFMDFSLAFLQNGPFFYYGMLDNWNISTQAIAGFAFGDWKKAKIGPLCDVLLCDEFMSSQWKVRLPEITVGYYLNRIRAGVAFEQKLMDSFTLNFQLDAAMNNGFNQLKYPQTIYGWGDVRYSQVYSRERILNLSVQPRYYVLQKKQRMIGRGGNGFSGLYTGLNSEFSYYKGKHSFSNFQTPDLKRETKLIQTGALVGYQLRLFRHGYFDANTSYNFQDHLGSSETSFGFRTNVTLGLAF